jgi:hypothetical protein
MTSVHSVDNVNNVYMRHDWQTASIRLTCSNAVFSMVLEVGRLKIQLVISNSMPQRAATIVSCSVHG